MELFPTLQLGWLNGWLPLAILYAVFGVLLIIFPRDVVRRLYHREGWERRDYVRRGIGLAVMLAWLALAILTPLKVGEPVFWVGMAVWLVGLIGFVMALVNYRQAPFDRPIITGIYRYSRNPQILFLVVAFFGVGIAMGSWTAVLILTITLPGMHTRILAEERTCLSQYGDSYAAYMDDVPRYLKFG